jgi:hypothetical protein
VKDALILKGVVFERMAFQRNINKYLGGEERI